MMGVDNQYIINLLRKDPEKALVRLYSDYYTYLCDASYKMIHDSNAVEDIVQEVLLEIWKKRDIIEFRTSIKAYLRRATVNRTLNYIRSKRMDFDDADEAEELFSIEARPQREMEAQDTASVINACIESLPEKCKIIFAMSRFEEMSYQEIATALEISRKTVENQISKALKILRRAVYPYVEQKK